LTIGAGKSGSERQSSFSTLCVLIVVDTVGALASGGLKNNCYMIDNNHYLGSWREGSEDLHTVCQDGQQIVWDVVSVSPETPIAISGFSERIVEEGTCAPKRLSDGSWAGRVESRVARRRRTRRQISHLPVKTEKRQIG
jgi:hypothetical protein